MGIDIVLSQARLAERLGHQQRCNAAAVQGRDNTELAQLNRGARCNGRMRRLLHRST
jgi:hypothetical protein